jgi:hypothetical protein
MTGVMRVAVVLAAVLLVQACKQEGEGPKSPQPSAPEPGKKPTPAEPGKPGAAPESPSSGKTAEQKAPEGCNSDFSQRIQASTTLTERCSPYTLKQVLSVEGWDLTIEPGVEIRIDADQRIDVGYGREGRLIARGTAEKPIRFVSNGRKEPGAWRKIVLFEQAGGSVLEHVLIEHAGREGEAALESKARDVSLKNVRFVGIKGQVLREAGRASLAGFADNDLSQAGSLEVIAVLTFESAAAIQGANKWPEKAVVQLEGRVQKDLQLPNAGVPYRVVQPVTTVVADRDGGTASLKVAPGVVFQMGEDTRWDIGYSQHGQLEAVGTAEQPIVFTRYGEPRAGSWRGLIFFDGAQRSVLEHVRVEFAGTKDGAALHYQRPRGLGKLKHVTIRKSAGHAIWAAGADTQGFEGFSDNTFEDIGRSTLRVEAHMVSKLGTGNTYPQDGAIELEGRIGGDLMLTAQGAPYRVLQDVTVEGVDDVTPATVTLEAGTVVQFGPGGRFSVGYTRPGALVAVGTAEKPITLTAATEEGWKGLHFHQKGKLQLEHAIVEKTVDTEQALKVGRRSPGGKVQSVLFKSVKLPIRNCVGRKLSIKDTKADPGVKLESKKGC